MMSDKKIVGRPFTPKCVECGKKDKDGQGVFDMYARFWCEQCLIFVLGELTPATERKQRRRLDGTLR
jgi:hypothetical protein